MPLSADDAYRYSRQTAFRPLGPEGQQRLMSSRIAIVGCGALGSVIAEIMVRAGVGYARLIDRDFVDASNLPRQALFDEEDAARVLPKAVAAARKLARLNSAARVEPLVTQVVARNVEHLTAGVDLILDGTDNFPTRFLLNDAAVRHARPWIFGAAVAARGMMIVVRPGVTPCLRCVLGDMPPPGSIPSCDQEGVLASTVHTVAALECVEALKFLTGNIAALEQRLVEFDLWQGRFDYRGVTALRGRGHCPACEQGRYEYLEGTLEVPELLAGRGGVHILPHEGQRPPDLDAVARQVDPAGQVTRNEFLLHFLAEGCLVTLFADGRAIIQGAVDAQQARALYDKYVRR